MLITVEAMMATNPCPAWPEERVRETVGDGLRPSHPNTLAVFIALPWSMGVHVLARLLSVPNRRKWVANTHKRAEQYAAVAVRESHPDADLAKSWIARIRTLRFHPLPKLEQAEEIIKLAHYTYTSSPVDQQHSEHTLACMDALSLLDRQQ